MQTIYICCELVFVSSAKFEVITQSQVRSLVGVFEEDTKSLREYVKGLHSLCSKLVATQNQVTSIYCDLAKHIQAYDSIFPVENASESSISATLQQFATYVSKISSWQHIMASQVADGVVYPLSRFLDTDLRELDTMSKLHQTASVEVDQAINHYWRCRRKDPNQEYRDANEQVYMAKKKFHQMALHYYSKLNLLQLSRKAALLEPLLGLLHANKAFFSVGHETLFTADIDGFLSTIGTDTQKVQAEQRTEREDTLELIDSIITQSQIVYFPEPPLDLASIPPDTTLTNKSGYLNVQKKLLGGVMSSWEKQYVFTEGGNLLSMCKGEVAGALLLELDITTTVHATDTDDRRHTFQVANSKKAVILQALNDRERDEWMLTIHNVAKEGGYVKDTKMAPSSSLLSGVGQFFADKFQAASAAIGSSASAPGTPTSPAGAESVGFPSSASVQSAMAISEAIPQDAPIMFDLLSSLDGTLTLEEDGTLEEKPSEESGAKVEDPKSRLTNSFTVRFLGSMGINVDRVVSFLAGQNVLCEVMRRILAARAIHNVFSTSEFQLSVGTEKVLLLDSATNGARLQHFLADISYWAVHNENNKLFGYITRQHDSPSSGHTGGSFSCFVYEADVNGIEICNALGTAAKTAYHCLLEKKAMEKRKEQEKKLLLANIANLPDMSPQVSPDGQFLILDEPEVEETNKEPQPVKIETSQESEANTEPESDA
ncbi:DCC-interacting protein 13-alpha-like isoform X2 [Oratosquilla oratoria]|uniref:DCC-interacting protein 13-alpha-like isoform X2 n=1 Tax=Oratosquilla oratoria TaxID=337810 RepID=UPI003F773299